MGVFHIFKIVQMVTNRPKRQISRLKLLKKDIFNACPKGKQDV